MTADEVKERLRAYRRICNECRELEQKIKDRREDMVQPRAVRTDAFRGSRGNGLENAIEIIDECEHKLCAKKEARDKALKDVRVLISKVTGDSDEINQIRIALKAYYLDRSSMYEVGVLIGYDERTAYRRVQKGAYIIAKVVSDCQ